MRVIMVGDTGDKQIGWMSARAFATDAYATAAHLDHKLDVQHEQALVGPQLERWGKPKPKGKSKFSVGGGSEVGKECSCHGSKQWRRLFAHLVQPQFMGPVHGLRETWSTALRRLGGNETRSTTRKVHVCMGAGA